MYFITLICTCVTKYRSCSHVCLYTTLLQTDTDQDHDSWQGCHQGGQARPHRAPTTWRGWTTPRTDHRTSPRGCEECSRQGMTLNVTCFWSYKSHDNHLSHVISCNCHVILVWSHVIIVWLSCDRHVISCDTHVTVMCTHVILVWLSCDAKSLKCMSSLVWIDQGNHSEWDWRPWQWQWPQEIAAAAVGRAERNL